MQPESPEPDGQSIVTINDANQIVVDLTEEESELNSAAPTRIETISPDLPATISHSSSLELERITNTLLKNVAASSRRVYQGDVYQFFCWLAEHNFNLGAVGYEELSEYRAWLEGRYQKRKLNLNNNAVDFLDLS